MMKSQCVKSHRCPFQSEAIYSFEKATSALVCSSHQQISGESFSLSSQICPQMSASVSRADSWGRERPQGPSLSSCSFLWGLGAWEGCEPSLWSSHSAIAAVGRESARPLSVGQILLRAMETDFAEVPQVGFPRTHIRGKGLTLVRHQTAPRACVSVA